MAKDLGSLVVTVAGLGSILGLGKGAAAIKGFAAAKTTATTAAAVSPWAAGGGAGLVSMGGLAGAATSVPVVGAAIVAAGMVGQEVWKTYNILEEDEGQRRLEIAQKYAMGQVESMNILLDSVEDADRTYNMSRTQLDNFAAAMKNMADLARSGQTNDLYMYAQGIEGVNKNLGVSQEEFQHLADTYLKQADAVRKARTTATAAPGVATSATGRGSTEAADKFGRGSTGEIYKKGGDYLIRAELKLTKFPEAAAAGVEEAQRTANL